MQVALDVVDLLQLQEIWSRRPIITAFTRLEERPASILSPVNFGINDLLPRLARLKRSHAWLAKNRRLDTDPARVPLADFGEDYLIEMYPEAPSPAEQRQSLFTSVYARFIITCYRGSVEGTGIALQALAKARAMEREQHLGGDALPLHGSPEWIPLNITDEIRSLDQRYDPAEPGTPATYVVSDDFWPLLVKVSPQDIERAIQLHCPPDENNCRDALRHSLQTMGDVAYAWNRSPSVVGLCYQLSNDPSGNAS